MRRLAVKVHRVATAEEVAELAGLGVDYVGFDADDAAFYRHDPDPTWADERHVLEAMLPDLMPALGDARAVVALPPAQLDPEAPARIADLGATLIQTADDPGDAVVDACAAAGVALVCEDGYIESTRPVDFVDVGDPDRSALAFYEADLFPTSEDPLSPLTHPEEGVLGLAEIDEIAARAPLFLHVGVTPGTIAETARLLAGTRVAGLAFRLADARLPTSYAYRFDELVELLEILRRSD